MLRQFGGPLLTCAVLAAALGVSFARRREERRRRQSQHASHDSSVAAAGAGGSKAGSKYFAVLSAEAIKLLVATAPLPRCIIDVRPDPQRRPLPPELAAAAVAIPEAKLAAALTSPAAWAAARAAAAAAAPGGAPGGPRAGPAAAAGPPSTGHVVVFLDEADDGRARRAARVAAALGFDRTAVAAGGLEGYERSGGGGGGGEVAATIGGDALAALLGRLPLPPPPAAPIAPPVPPPPSDAPADANGSSEGWGEGGGEGEDNSSGGEGGGAVGWQVAKACALDVRRHDERTLYGAIPGAMHIPADELASALALGPREFGRRYHFERPPQEEPLVVHSRTTGRAFWAAQAAADAGYTRLLVLRGGAYSWRSDGVKPYPSYQLWDPPPEPEPAPTESHDPAAALEELLSLGLVTL